MAAIQVLSGLNAGETHELREEETLVGRHPDCHVALRDSSISRRHARITRAKDGFYLDDVGSQHGTRLNGELVLSPRRLKDSDEIEFSQTKIVFRDGGSLEATLDRPSTIMTSVDVLRDQAAATDSQETPKWRALLEITRSLGVSLDLRTILPNVLENIFRILPAASRGCIMLADRRTGELATLALKQAAGAKSPTAPPLSRTVTDKVMSEGKAVLSTDVGEDDILRASDSVLEFKMRSVLCAPLVGASEHPFGLIHLDAQNPARQFSSRDLDILVNIGNLVGQAVDHARLHETQLEFDRQQRALETARQVQMHFLPQDRPTVPGYQLHDYYAAADAIGGDYFGYTELPDGQLTVAVGDVAGHGIPAALLMARLCAEARYCLVTNIIPSEAVQMLNQEMCKQKFLFFITFAICVLDAVRHEMTVVNSGHMPPLLWRARTGEVESVGVHIVSPPLGIDPGVSYRQVTTKVEPGDVVLMYTDGVSESPNPDRDQFGIDRVEQAVRRATDAKDAVDALLEAVREFAAGTPQEDDICVVAFSRNRD